MKNIGFFISLISLSFSSAFSQNAGNAIEFTATVLQNAYLGTWFNYQSFTISVWINPLGYQESNAIILDNGHTETKSWVFQTNGELDSEYIFSQAGSNKCKVTLDPDKWSHLALVSENGNFSIYLNGLLKGYSAAPPIVYDGTQSLTLSKGESGTGFWTGKIDDLKIYTDALTPMQIREAISIGVSNDATITPYAYYPMDESAGPDINGGLNVPLGNTRAGFRPSDAGTLPLVCNTGLSSNLKKGLVGYYPFCNNSDDISTSLNNPTIFNATFGEDSEKNLSNAAYFKGAQKAVITRSVSGDFSISFYLNTTQDGINGTLGGTQWYDGFGLVGAKVNGLKDDFGVALVNGKVLFGTGNPDVSIASNAINDGTWHHVAVTRDQSLGQIKLFIDGLLVDSAYAGKQSLTSSSAINFGSVKGNCCFFVGALDEIMIYNRTITEQEVNQIYSQVVTETKDSFFNEGVFTIFPNPAYDNLKINFAQNSYATIRIMNTCGILVKKMEVLGNEAILDLNSFANGLYWIEATFNNVKLTKKFVVGR